MVTTINKIVLNKKKLAPEGITTTVKSCNKPIAMNEKTSANSNTEAFK